MLRDVSDVVNVPRRPGLYIASALSHARRGRDANTRLGTIGWDGEALHSVAGRRTLWLVLITAVL